MEMKPCEMTSRQRLQNSLEHKPVDKLCLDLGAGGQTGMGVCAIKLLIALIKPLTEPRKLPVRGDIEIKTAPDVKIAGACVIAAVAVFYIIFW